MISIRMRKVISMAFLILSMKLNDRLFFQINKYNLDHENIFAGKKNIYIYMGEEESE